MTVEVGERTVSGRRRWLTLIVLSLGVSLIVIDGTIVNVALPVMIHDLRLDFTSAQWVSTLYTLVFAGLLITTGRLGDRLGRRRLFVAGVIVFVAGSLLAGAAHSATALLGARAIQGVGGALILPCTLSTVNATFQGRDRTIAFAVWGSVISAMAAVGPLLGGWLTTDASWRWIFFINVPVGAIILLGIVLYVPETRAHGFAPGLDVDGFLLSAIGLAALVFGLVEGRTYGWLTPEQDLTVLGATWSTGAPISAPAAAIIIGVLFLALFALWERHRAKVGRSALMNLGLFRFRSFAWGNVAVLIVALGEFGLLFTLPLYLQNVLGLSAIGSGLVLAAMAVGAFITGGGARELARVMTPARVASAGLALEAGGLLILALVVRADTAGWLLALILVVYGAGLGLASAQLTGVTLSDVPPERSGQGSATQSTTRQLGSALGFAVLGTILASSVAAHASGALDGIRGLPAGMGHQLEQQLSSSAGGILPQVQHGNISVPGGSRDAVISALADAFADGTRLTLLIGAAVLATALAATFLLPAGSQSQPAATDDGRRAGEDPHRGREGMEDA